MTLSNLFRIIGNYKKNLERKKENCGVAHNSIQKNNRIEELYTKWVKGYKTMLERY